MSKHQLPELQRYGSVHSDQEDLEPRLNQGLVPLKRSPLFVGASCRMQTPDKRRVSEGRVDAGQGPTSSFNRQLIHYSHTSVLGPLWFLGPPGL